MFFFQHIQWVSNFVCFISATSYTNDYDSYRQLASSEYESYRQPAPNDHDSYRQPTPNDHGTYRQPAEAFEEDSLAQLLGINGHGAGEKGRNYINPLVMNGLSPPYHLDESIFIFRDIRIKFYSFFDEIPVSKQNSPRWDAALCGVTSGAILFAYVP